MHNKKFVVGDNESIKIKKAQAISEEYIGNV